MNRMLTSPILNEYFRVNIRCMTCGKILSKEWLDGVFVEHNVLVMEDGTPRDNAEYPASSFLFGCTGCGTTLSIGEQTISVVRNLEVVGRWRKDF